MLSPGGDVVLAPSSVLQAAVLSGLRIGRETDTVNLVELQRALARGDLAPRGVALVPTPQDHLCNALRAGLVDAAVSYPPESERIVRTELAHVLVDSATPDLRIPDALAFDAAPGGDPTGPVAGFVTAYWRAVACARDNRTAALRLTARHVALAPTTRMTCCGTRHAPDGRFELSVAQMAASLHASRACGPALELADPAG
jgi:NitT/TauT family transport system substrate-binding protein